MKKEVYDWRKSERRERERKGEEGRKKGMDGVRMEEGKKGMKMGSE